MKRTLRQNRACHKWFEELSRELNNQGVDFRAMVKNLRVDATPELVKSVFRTIGTVKFGKLSTADLTTKEINECYDEFNRLLALEGIHISFPSYQDTDEYLSSYEETKY